MPPKKDKKKGSGSGPKEVDPDAYIRQPVQFPDLSAEQIGTDSPLGGTYYGIAAQFSEWSVEGESWDVPIPEETLIPIQYPPVVRVALERPIIEFLNLNEEVEGAADAKKGKKEAPKKGKGPVEVTEEPAFDEHGRALPRVFVDAASEGSAEVPPDGAQAAGCGLIRAFRTPSSPSAAATTANPPATDVPAADGEGAVAGDEAPPPAEPVPPASAVPSPQEDGVYMSEIDPLMCATFELVKRFSATLMADKESPYLWRAIHPQLPDGRPYYNSSGRYCVKLFVAGAWRKVYVNDNVPLSESGEPAVASSSCPQELWPMLLAKAVYTVYTALGYHKIFDTLGLENAAPSATDKASAFVAFALSALTGWLPTAPMAIPAGTDEDKGSFLQDIAFGGCRCISLADKIRSNPLLTSEIAVDESVYDGKLTKKILRDLQETKNVRTEHLKRVVCKREADIRATTEALNAVHAEFFCFVITNPGGTKFRVYPVLTIAAAGASPPALEAYTPGSPTSTKLAPTDSPHLSPVKLPRPSAQTELSELSRIELLVDWEIAGQVPTGLTSEHPVVEGEQTENSASDASPPEEWLASTELQQKWIPFSDFCDSMSPDGTAPYGVSVVSFETRSRASQTQQMHWAWSAPAEAAADAGSKGGKPPAKGKEKKSAAADSGGAQLTPLGVPIAGSDQGVFPPTILHVDVRSLLKLQAVPNVEEASCTEGEEVAPVENPEPSPIEETALQVESAIGGVEKPDPAEYIAVVVYLQGEILDALNDAASPPAVPDADEKEAGQGHVAVTTPMVADDVVLVLQEIRRDEDEPLVMRVALSQASLITPVTRTTFHIPISRISSSPNEGNLTFWVRLFTKSSVMMSFASPCPLSLGPAETVWQSSDEGVATVIDGESNAVRSNIESIIFRASFLAPVPTVDEPPRAEDAPAVEAADTAEAAIDKPETENPEPISEPPVPVVDDIASAHNKSSSYVAGNRVLAFLHVTDRIANSFLSLVELSGGYPEVCTSLPRLCGNIVQLTPAVSAAGPIPGQLAMSVLGKCFLSKDANHLSGFKWKLILLSRKDVPLTTKWSSIPPPSAGPTVPTAIKRFAGSYTPNNKLVLFRDEFSGVLSDAPVAVRVSLLPFSYKEEAVSGTENDVWLKIRLINPMSRAVVREYRGRGVVPIYAIDLKQFIPTEGEGTAAPPAKGKKDDKKGGKGAPAEETVNFIVECVLDDTVMAVPQKWRSRFPYSYSEMFPISLVGKPEVLQKGASQASVVAPDAAAEPPKFVMPQGALPPDTCGPEWVVDVVGGAVASASHDLYDILRFKDIKNSWLEKSSDRFDRGTAAVAYNAARLGPRDDSAEEEIGGLLAGALGSAVDTLKPAEAILPDIPEYKEHITTLGDYELPKLVDPKSEEQKEVLAKEAMDLDSDAQSAMEALAALNSLLKDDVTKRMEDIIAKLEKNSNELREVWKIRENAREFLSTQNTSLAFLLERAAEAKAKVFEPAEDPKKGAKGKKK